MNEHNSSRHIHGSDAVLVLQSYLADIERLRMLPFPHPTFAEWRLGAARALDMAFGWAGKEHHPYTQAFLAHNSEDTDTGSGVEAGAEKQEHYLNVIAAAENILRAAIDELQFTLLWQ